MRLLKHSVTGPWKVGSKEEKREKAGLSFLELGGDVLVALQLFLGDGLDLVERLLEVPLFDRQLLEFLGVDFVALADVFSDGVHDGFVGDGGDV